MRILLIEDDQRAARFVVQGLKQAGHNVDHATDGPTGLALGLDNSYDAALVDIMLPGLDGISLVRALRDKGRDLPVIILSAKVQVEDRVRGLEAGADDYLTKPFSFAELVARINAQVRRSQGMADPARLGLADLEMDIRTRRVSRRGTRIDLQPKEFALLEYLLRNAGRVVSKTMIMDHVWDYNFDPQTNVVEARICRLRDKIDRNSQNKLIHTIRGVGYVLKEEA